MQIEKEWLLLQCLYRILLNFALEIALVLVQWFSTDFAKRLRLYFAELQMKSGPTQYQSCLMLYPHSKWTQINCSLGHILFMLCSFIVLRMRAGCVTCWNLEVTDDYGLKYCRDWLNMQPLTSAVNDGQHFLLPLNSL